MRSSTTFSAFTAARLGLYASQKGLSVTGNNISNINTTGYTRQALEQISLRVGGADRYTSTTNFVIGSGALTTGVSQMRDPYLDIRYRTEVASVGAMETKSAGLKELSGVLDEVADGDGDGIIEKQFNDLVTQLQNMNTDHASDDVYDTLVRSSAESLIRLFNNYAERLTGIQENQAESFKQDVSSVNDILASIQTLNDTIMKSDLHGDSALELRDQRNLLIDQLSKYIKVDATYESVSIGAGSAIEKLVIKTAGDPARTLVDGNYVTELSLDPDTYALSLAALTDQRGTTLKDSVAVDLTDTELTGSLQASQELLTKSGEFSTADDIAADPDAATKRGIPYYQKALDGLAQKFAAVLNEANTGYLRDTQGNYVTSTGGILIKQSDIPSTGLTDTQKGLLTSSGVSLGGVLFSNSGNGDDTTGITASNISISSSWASGIARIQNSFVQGTAKPGQVSSSDNRNIVHIIALMDSDQVYLPGDVDANAATATQQYFQGSFQEMLINMQATLAQDSTSTSTLLDNYSAAATELDTNRESVSGVDLNDEAMSLMQYQKSYSAACRLMTTIDETLDKLINGTGIAGR